MPLEELKRWRRDQAASEGREPYFIFTNAVLEATLKAEPKSKEDLLAIKGWGKKKVEKYGDEVIAILNGNERHKDKASAESTNGVLTVSQFIQTLNETLLALKVVRVRGEINEPNSRNRFAFFNLKDQLIGAEKNYVVQCFLGWERYEALNHLVQNGIEVIVSGYPRVHQSGFLRLEVLSIEPVGEGALEKAFQALKKKLEAKGYFGPERKRHIPEFVKNIGLITSDFGAAITDFKKNLGHHGFKIFLEDVRVEGTYAEESLIGAIKKLNRLPLNLDVIVIMRGGGGLENLKAFNSERLAEAVALSRLPVITGIGHERDETIVGLTADLNLSTPTAVANFLRSQRENLISEVSVLAQNLEHLANRELADKKSLLKLKTAELNRGFGRLFSGFREIEHVFLKEAYFFETNLEKDRQKISFSLKNCVNIMERKFADALSFLSLGETAIVSLNPEAVLKRGYSIAYAGQRVLKSAADVEIGAEVKIVLADGKILTEVKNKEKANDQRPNA